MPIRRRASGGKDTETDITLKTGKALLDQSGHLGRTREPFIARYANDTDLVLRQRQRNMNWKECCFDMAAHQVRNRSGCVLEWNVLRLHAGGYPPSKP